MSEQTSGAALLARIKPQLREESTQIVMGSPLLAEWESLQEQLAESQAKDRQGNRMADGTSKRTRELAEQIVDIEAAIQEVAVTIRFRAMTKDQWRTLCDDHPPRKTDLVDAHAGYNRDAVLDEAVRICMVDPVFDDCKDPACEHADCGTWQHFVGVLSPAEWNELRDTVNSVNRAVVDVPKSALASLILRKPETT